MSNIDLPKQISILKIDINSPSELKKAITNLQNRRKRLLREHCNYHPIMLNSSKYNITTVYPKIEEWFASIKNPPGQYYVYLHCNPKQTINIQRSLKDFFLGQKYNLFFRPFYVGMGMGNRYLDFSRNDSYRKIRGGLLKEDKEVYPIKIIENVSEESALEYENFFMYFLGLRALDNHGYLVNLQENDSYDMKKYINENSFIKEYLKSTGFKL